MELNLSSDQELLRSATHSFLEREATSAQIRALAETPAGVERSWWNTAAELGWTSLLVPEALGGGSISGAPLEDLAILAEESGFHAAPGPLAVSNVVIAALSWNNDDTHAREIARIMEGSAIATWAAYEPDDGWSPGSPRMTASFDTGEYRLNGIKDRVECGDQADLFLLSALLDGRVRQFIVPSDTPGITIERVWSLDLTSHYAIVRFDGVRVPATAIVGSGQDTAAMLERQSQIIWMLQCAEISGATERVFNMALDWAMDRYAFGRSLASYQAIKHRFANMKTYLEAMHAITAGAMKAVNQQSGDAAQLARAAKIFVTTQASEIMQDCVQIHGGIGVTWEHDLHLFLRRATVNRILFGTPEELRDDLAQMLKDREIAA